MPTREEIAKMIDHSLLHPTMDDEALREGIEVARRCGVASVCIKPYAVKMAAELLDGSGVLVGTVVGFPHGNSKVDVKVYETVWAIADGATEIDMVVNGGKVLSGEWDYVKDEIAQVLKACRTGGAILKVIFENDFITGDEDKIRLCEICSELGVDFVKTSTGYGFVKQEDGSYAYKGATDQDLALMRRHSAPEVQVKAAGGVRTLEDVLRVRALGVTRIGATATEAILAAVDGKEAGSGAPEGY